jgi:hypothetical protein
MMDLFILTRRAEFVSYGQRQAVLVAAQNALEAYKTAAKLAGTEGGEAWYASRIVHVGKAEQGISDTVLLTQYAPE